MKKETFYIYVSTYGCDKTGDGTQSCPVASLEKARDLARAKKSNTTICIREGTYAIEQPVLFDEQDSNLTICAYPGEKVILSGAKKLRDLNWQKDEQNPHILNAFIGAYLNPDRLFINKVPYIMARYPDYQEGKIPLGGTVTEAQIRERSQNWANPCTGYLRALHNAAWGGNDYYILGKNENSPTGLDLEWIGDNNRGHFYKADDLMVENIREELDAPGEWFYDSCTGILSLIPFDQDVWTGCEEAEIALNTEIFRFEGKSPENTVRGITITNLIFENTKRTMFATKEQGKEYCPGNKYFPGKEYFPLMRGDWAVVRSGCIFMENAEHIMIDSCTFRHIGGNAVFAWGYNAEHIIKNNELSHIGSTGIMLVGSPTAVSDASFWEHIHYPEHQTHAVCVANPDHVGPVSEEYPRDIEISENHIFDVGIFEKQSTGINLSVSSRIKILHNTIHKSARSNINVNDGSFGGHEIAYNDIFDSQTETMDHGPFNSWGRDRFWSVPVYDCMGNNGTFIRHYKKDGKEYDIALLDAYQTTRIHHNRFHHDKPGIHSWGIDLDDGSSNYEIYENLCLGIGIKLREGFERKVHHNIIIGGQMQIHCTYYGARDQIFGNLFIHSNPWGFAGLGEDTENRLREGSLYVEHNAYYCYDGAVSLPEFWTNLNFDQNACIGMDPGFENLKGNLFQITNKEVLKTLHFPESKSVCYGKNDCAFRTPEYVICNRPNPSKLNETRWLGAVISDIDQAIMSATATAGTNGVYFKRVPKDCEAYSIGYRTGQVVKQIHGVDVENVAAFLKMMESVQ